MKISEAKYKEIRSLSGTISVDLKITNFFFNYNNYTKTDSNLV